jgi:hypothetical protein
VHGDAVERQGALLQIAGMISLGLARPNKKRSKFRNWSVSLSTA